jgi:hypothetical protein
VGGSGSGARGSGTVRDRAGSGILGSGARFGRSGARPGARFRDAPARSAVRGSGPGGGGGGRFGNTGFEVSFRGTEVLIYPRGCSIDSGQVIGVRE